MSTVADPETDQRTSSGWVILLAAVAVVVAAASFWFDTTVVRLLLAVTLPMAIAAWANRVSVVPRRHLLVLSLLCGVLGALHVALTSPVAPAVVDSHMLPELATLLPGGPTRIVVAWVVPVLWGAMLLSMAAEAWRRCGAIIGGVALAAAGLAPLAFAGAFPTDAYLLLWDRTAFAHPTYAAGALAVLLVVATTLGQRQAGTTQALA